MRWGSKPENRPLHNCHSWADWKWISFGRRLLWQSLIRFLQWTGLCPQSLSQQTCRGGSCAWGPPVQAAGEAARELPAMVSWAAEFWCCSRSLAMDVYIFLWQKLSSLDRIKRPFAKRNASTICFPAASLYSNFALPSRSFTPRCEARQCVMVHGAEAVEALRPGNGRAFGQQGIIRWSLSSRAPFPCLLHAPLQTTRTVVC